ncbi:MAG: hypothetical protein LC135_00905 [Phycisphaerae bacterium]|nr:hypothetical protein [Phycisphaerae bacterium]MCZ2398410.1 hypothetical protein [Phycisphaerae bacterium]
MDERSRQHQFEEQFLAQLRARALALTRGLLPADIVLVEPTAEGIEDVRDTLRRLEVFDRGALDGMPGTRAAQFRFQKSHLGGLLRSTLVRMRARVLTPVEEFVRGQSPGPIGREQVLAALARYQVLPASERPTGVVLASATGFTPEARRMAEGGGPPTLVLMGLRPDGGWDVDMPAGLRSSAWARLFELETQDDRLRRVLHHLEQDALALDSRGIPLRELSQRAGLPLAQTELLVRQACRTQPRLMTVVHDGQLHVARSPLEQTEGETMSIWARIRRLFGAKPSVAEQVRQMTAQRVRLEQQRHELDGRIGALEAQEREIVQTGAAAKTDVERKQAAGKLVRVRRELGRIRSQANIFTQQIDIIGTHIHHMTLAEQGRRMSLPKAEELTRQAAEAEGLIAELSANADLARSIEVTGESPMMAEEELAIMEEFKQAAASQQSAPAAQAAPAPEAAKTPRTATPTASPAPANPPGGKTRESAKPEVG